MNQAAVDIRWRGWRVEFSDGLCALCAGLVRAAISRRLAQRAALVLVCAGLVACATPREPLRVATEEVMVP